MSNGSPDPYTPELPGIRLLLEAILTSRRYDIVDLVVGRFAYQEMVLEDVPGPGARRILVDRQGQGQAALAVPSGTVTPVLPVNEARVGGEIVNWGATNVALYLCDAGDIGGVGNALSPQAANRPALVLNAGGGSWDYRLGNILYGGAVQAAGIAGATTLSVAEF